MRDFIYGIVTILLFVATNVQADVFKCTAEDGGVTFQQTPCPDEKVERVATPEAVPEELDCQYSVRFAESTARFMRAGLTSAEIFARYDGIDSLSRPSISVINYVYSFRTTDDVSVERISSLAEAKCQVGSFGEATCESFPSSFTEQFGSCDGTVDAVVAAGAAAAAPTPGLNTATRPVTKRRSTEETATCKQHYRDAIDDIDAEMRRGYSSEQGEAYRQQLRLLTEKLRAC
jgi:hypothetical protein